MAAVPMTAMQSCELLTLHVSFKSRRGEKAHLLSYDPYLCCGEVVRNICVNLGIDPDTVEGLTRNISILCNGALWSYNPHESLLVAGVQSGDTFAIEMI